MQKVSAALLRTEATLRGYLHSWVGDGISLEEIFEGKDDQDLQGIQQFWAQ